jgi:hypothetical protein
MTIAATRGKPAPNDARNKATDRVEEDDNMPVYEKSVDVAVPVRVAYDQ